MGWTDQIDLADEQFHERSNDPYWSENSLLGFNVPERDAELEDVADGGGAENAPRA